MEIDSKEVIEIDACSNDNLTKLRDLVEKLDNHHQKSDEYHDLIKEIESTIKNEREIIKYMVKSDRKIERYESICATILTIISTARL